ncbi:hypothetical protein AK812_SmicGene25458 [Symbiodinium microadriaticum]|uniref:Uncharacterized protein n=1 Tax=Symbiodinium microadriaticum TaxID=2951 RepID=A0A1Q9DC41_SYMMI|nr:hypothetical protein AK812_SmicGene25458 [Symbiodinium microadriaticum]
MSSQSFTQDSPRQVHGTQSAPATVLALAEQAFHNSKMLGQQEKRILLVAPLSNKPSAPPEAASGGIALVAKFIAMAVARLLRYKTSGS